MSKRLTSERLVAVASEAKVAHETAVGLHRAMKELSDAWDMLPDDDRKAVIDTALLNYMPSTINNSIAELTHFKLQARHIERERLRRRSRQKTPIDTSDPDIYPFPNPKEDVALVPTEEDKRAYANWLKEGKLP